MYTVDTFKTSHVPQIVIDSLEYDESVYNIFLHDPSFDDAMELKIDPIEPLTDETKILLDTYIRRTLGYTGPLNQRILSFDDLVDSFISFRLLEEQLFYIRNQSKDCDVYCISVWMNAYYFGGVFVFYNPKQPNFIIVQGILKSLTLLISEHVYPNVIKTANLRNLNSIVQPQIQNLALKLGVRYIYVSPINKQADILEKYYGYTRVSIGDLPHCSILWAKDEFTSNRTEDMFVKKLY